MSLLVNMTLVETTFFQIHTQWLNVISSQEIFWYYFIFLWEIKLGENNITYL